jgi:hypothetical protein
MKRGRSARNAIAWVLKPRTLPGSDSVSLPGRGHERRADHGDLPSAGSAPPDVAGGRWRSCPSGDTRDRAVAVARVGTLMVDSTEAVTVDTRNSVAR